MNAVKAKVVKSAGRALAVLEYFDEITRPASAAEIRSQLGLPASSATALLGSLVELGYLNYDAGKRTYMPTLRVGLLGEWTHSHTCGNRPLQPLLENLGQETGQLVVLGTRCRLNAQYIHVVRSSATNRPVKRGTLAPLTRTAVGWVLISKLNDQDALRLVTRVNAEEEPHRRVSASWLIDRIQEVRERGFAFCFGRVTPEVGAISMALPVAPGQPPMVLAISGSGASFLKRKDDLVEAMRSHVQQYLNADLSGARH